MEEVYPFLHNALSELDQDTYRLIEFEKRRQERKIIMIASESICPQAVLEAEASVFSNIYAEGYPSLRLGQREREQVLNFGRHLAFYRRYGNRRHYKGCDYVDFIEVLAQWRAAQVFAHSDGNISVKPEDIFVNVQPLSGAAANNAVYQAFVKPGDVVMGLALPHGGHLTHGSEFNRSGKLYHVIHYEVNPNTGKIDYDALRKMAHEQKPKMIIAGASAYPWDINWRLLREISDEISAILFSDIAHPSGLVAARLFPSPVGYAHVTTMTTHKTLCGPRAAIILTTNEEHARKIDNAVFPGEQGGPHINTIAALAVTFKMAASKEFKNLMKRVVDNAAHLAQSLQKEGLELAYGGTNTHLCLIDLKKVQEKSGIALKGDVVSNILDLCGITCNKNTIPGDITSADSSAIRLGTTWISQLGMGTTEMERIAHIVAQVIFNIQTFSVHTGGGVRCRGRISKEIVDSARREVAKLLKRDEHPLYPLYPHYYHFGFASQSEERVPENAKVVDYNGIKVIYHRGNPEAELKASQDGAVLISNPGTGLLEITGERAEWFLSEVIAGSLQNLPIKRGIKTWLLDGKGEPIADVIVFRMPEEEANFSRFLMITQPQHKEMIKEWLRDLSDGFISFDEKCIYNKVDGPVVVTDLFEMAPATVAVSLIGAKAKEIVCKVEPALENLPCFALRSVHIEGIPVIVAHTTMENSPETYEFYVTQENASKLVERLQNCGNGHIKESGYAVIENLRKNAGFETSDVSRLMEKFPSSFHASKPYFIGEQACHKSSCGEKSKREHIFQTYKGEPRKTPLSEEHKKLTDRDMVPFAGWMMPVLYTSILDEHKAVRERAGLFDVTHMGVMEVTGPGASRYLDLVTTNYATKMQIGQSLYAYLIDPDGKVIDDIMMYRRGVDNFMIVINASNAEKDFEWMCAVASREVIIDRDCPEREIDVKPVLRDLKNVDSGDDRKVDIALQGPRSLDIMKAIAGNDQKTKKMLERLPKAHFIEVEMADSSVLICHSGYTGEECGFEIYLHPNDAPHFWNLLLEKGKPFGIEPTGLGARDSTRTEAGYPLYGHELANEFQITPFEAGYASFVKYHKPFFIGKAPLLKKDESSKNVIVRFEMNETGIRAVRPGTLVVNSRGQYIGTVTSCTFIGTKQVGMAYINNRYAKEGNKLGLFIGSGEKKIKHKPIADLQLGDTFPLHESAVIVSRFPLRTSVSK